MGHPDASQSLAGQVEEVVADLDRKIAAVPEPAMRRRLVCEALTSSTPHFAWALLSAVLNRPPQRSSPSLSAFDLLRDTLHDVLLDPEAGGVSYALRRDMYRRAAEAGDEMVMRVLRSLPTQETLDRPDLRLPRELADIPLGRRRSLARSDDPNLLEKLALDPDPIVIQHLLLNPRTREVDVQRIAAMRPVAVSTLTEIYRSPRWSMRGRVRTALARNPYCPTEIALKLVGSMPLPDLREMRSDPGLHPEMRAQVEAELLRRKSIL